MDWKPVVVNDQGLIKVPKRWLQIHYYEALNILFRFENSLRVFVYCVLKNEFLERWKDCNFSISGSNAQSIAGIASKRISQAESFGYLGFDIKAAMMHLTSGELVELITSDAYWPKFKGYFRGQKDIIKNKLLEIGSIRNSLAHFRPFKNEDIELVKQNARHTLLGVEASLECIFMQGLRVPTNTPDDWYKAISTLGSDHVKTVPYYSRDELWIKVQLSFTATQFKKSKWSERFFAFDIAKINSPNLLKMQLTLAKFVTYVSENVNYPQLDGEFNLQVTKDINFVFRKDVLVANFQEIADSFREVLVVITEECNLLGEDNLARGQVIETVEALAWWNEPKGDQKGTWNYRYADLFAPYQSHHSDEYWGEHQFTTDVVASCKRYPWMPEDISSAEGFSD